MGQNHKFGMLCKDVGAFWRWRCFYWTCSSSMSSALCLNIIQVFIVNIVVNINSIITIGLYTPINYFGRYATCSHKDGGRSHIQSRETIGQEDHVTCLKLRPRVNLSPAFGATYKMRTFYKYVVFKHPCSLLRNFFAVATRSFTKFLRSSNTLPSAWINRREKQLHGWASQTFIYNDYETLSSLWETARF